MSVFDEVASLGVVPVIAIDDAQSALPLADALLEAGLPIAEITLRTPAALDVIGAIARYRPEMLIGAGTVLTEAQVDAVADAGARFALSPGVDAATLARASTRKLPFAPGIASATDLQVALRANCELVKFFPAMAVGGVNMLKAIAGPYLHTGIGFNPTGGVSLSNMADWLSYGPVRAVGGTWIAGTNDIAVGNWAEISGNANEAIAKAQKIRGQSSRET